MAHHGLSGKGMFRPAALGAAAALCLIAGCGSVTRIDDQLEFHEQVLAAEVPVLVQFSKAGCSTCVMLEPQLQRLVADYGRRAKFAECQVEDLFFNVRQPDLKRQYDIRLYPTVILYADGQELRWSPARGRISTGAGGRRRPSGSGTASRGGARRAASRLRPSEPPRDRSVPSPQESGEEPVAAAAQGRAPVTAFLADDRRQAELPQPHADFRVYVDRQAEAADGVVLVRVEPGRDHQELRAEPPDGPAVGVLTRWRPSGRLVTLSALTEGPRKDERWHCWKSRTCG
jgi:thioredoxin 1